MNENNQIPYIQTPGPNNNSILMIILLVIVVVGGSVGLAAWLDDPIKVGAVFGFTALAILATAFFIRFLQHKDFSSGADARGQIDAANTNTVIGMVNTMLPMIANQGGDQVKRLQEYNDALSRNADAMREMLAQKDEQHAKQIAELQKLIRAALPGPSGASVPRETLQPVSRETVGYDDDEEDEVPARPIGQRITTPSTPVRTPTEWEYRFKMGNDTARGDLMEAIVYWFDENEKPGSPYLDRRTAVRKCSGLTFKSTEYTDALQGLVDAGIVEGVGAGTRLVHDRTTAITKLAEIRVEQFQRWGVLK